MTPARRVARRAGIIGTYALALLAVIMVVAAVGFYTLSDVPQPTDLALPQTVTVEYSDGSVMARLDDDNQNRTVVPLSQVSVNVRNAVIATEDRSFYSEPGVSLTGTARAAWNDLTGGSTQGGSGITQQYVKNAYLNSSQTLTRKLRELAISLKLSRNYSKDQILEWYLNTVYFGRGAYGIEAAAETFFGTTAARLSIAQSAVLAGLLRSPSYYDPAQNPQQAEQRYAYVLNALVDTGRLTATQAAGLPYPPTRALSQQQQVGTSGPTALLVEQVLLEVEAHGISRDDIYERGMTIRTTIDKSAQAAALRAITDTFANLTPAQRTIKNALVAVDPATGGVLAYYGGPDGTDYAGKPDYNDYVQGFRPPGSSMKPYVLADALSQNLAGQGAVKYALNSLVDGSYRKVIGGTPIYNDPGDQDVSSSSVTLADALKYSLNTTFDQLALDIGPDTVAATAHAAGIAPVVAGQKTLVNADGSTSFGIGIGDYPVRPIDQAVGYATLADGGVEHDAYLVSTVTDAAGSVVYTHATQSRRALDPKVANDVTLAMEPIASYSGVGLARTSAAKTGTEGVAASPTTNSGGNPNKGNSDAWLVGFTPQVSAAVWVGSGDSVHGVLNSGGGAEYGSDLPGHTWQAFMNDYLGSTPSAPMPTTQLITQATTVQPTYTPPPSTSSAPPSTTHPATPTPSRTPTPTPAPSPTRTPTRSTTPTPSVSCGLLGLACTTTTPPRSATRSPGG